MDNVTGRTTARRSRLNVRNNREEEVNVDQVLRMTVHDPYTNHVCDCIANNTNHNHIITCTYHVIIL